jgi:phosphoserine phosphatase RsbU/P
MGLLDSPTIKSQEATLVLQNGDQAGTRYQLPADKSILGRHPDCHIMIDLGAVSRQHAQIVKVGPDYFVEDLKSRNGTFVNDQQIAGQTLLKSGDRIKICDLEFLFEHPLTPMSLGLERDEQLGGFSLGVTVDDDEKSEMGDSRAVLSKLDLRGGINTSLRLSANPEVKLRAFLEITQSLCKSLSIDEVLPKLMESLFKIFLQADRGVVALKTKDDKIVPHAVKHRSGQDDQSIRLSRTIINEVLQSKQAILSADAASDTRFELSQSIADFRIRSLMCAPLLDSEGEALGLIQLDSLDQRNRFTADDLEVLAGVATQAAFVMETIKLHENQMRQQYLERDLKLAHQVQQGLLPSTPPLVEHYHFFDFYEPANQVGGDFYDYVFLPGGKLAVILADVSGKGMSAALVMAKLSADVRYCLASEPELDLAVNRINASFCRNGWEDRFVTFILVVIDPRRHELQIVNAGHMAPYIRQANGEVIAFGESESGLPLGISEDYAYTMIQRSLQSGECVAIFTDGISEAMNAQRDLYGMDRIAKQLGSAADSITQLGRELLGDVRQFVNGNAQSDDMCLVCFGRE